MAEIHLLRSGDEHLLIEAVARFKPGVSAFPPAFLDSPNTTALVAQAGGEIVGWVHGAVMQRVDGDTMALLYEIDVAEGRRRSGFGRELVDAFLGAVRDRGCSRVWVITDVDNDAAIALYEASGAVRSTDQALFTWTL